MPEVRQRRLWKMVKAMSDCMGKEAIATMKPYGGKYEIVNPSVSILAQPSVAIVDDNAKANGSEEVSKRYLDFLYTKQAQRLIGKSGYRPTDKEILQEFGNEFDLSIKLWTIDDFGGWEKAYQKYFDDDAMFVRFTTIRRGVFRMRNTVRQKRVKKARVIPGFRCTFGIVVLMLSLIVLIPLASVLVYSLNISPGEFFFLLWKSNVRNAFLTSIGLLACGGRNQYGVWRYRGRDFGKI